MRSPAGRCATAVLALAGVLVPAAAEPPDGQRAFFVHQMRMQTAPVVLVVFDELPLATLLDLDGDVDERLFPGFAELARLSTWYRNTTTSETFTKEARPALLTGSYPVRSLGETFTYPRSLFTLLGEGYEIRASDIPPNICPPSECDEPIEPPSVRRFQEFGSGERGSLFLSFMNDLEAPDRPRLHVLHVVFPHGPWRYLPSGQRYDEVEPMPGEVDEHGRGKSWGEDEWLVAQGYQRHVLQARLADRLVSALLVKLRRRGLLHRALLVVTSDHGIGWEPGSPKRLPTRSNVATLGWVPLFVKAPGQRGGFVSDAPAEAVDVLPTIADLLDAEMWPGVDGISLASTYPSRRKRWVVDVRVPRGRGPLMKAVEDKYELLAGGGRVLDPWRVAPEDGAALLGLPLDALSVTGASGVTFSSARVEALETADPDAGEFPAFFEGTLHGVAEGVRPLVAVAVNGTVAAVTRAYEAHGLTWFGAMLDPARFRARGNDVELFLVEDAGGRAVARLTERGKHPADHH